MKATFRIEIAFLFALVLTIVSTPVTKAQAPQLINFQAQVEGLDAASANVIFSIFDVQSGGTAIWTDSYSGLAVQNGTIQVLLGSNPSNPLPASVFENDGDRFLEITVNSETLSPRSRIASVAYALRAAVADRVEGGGSSGVTTLNTLTGDVNITAGDNVSITPEGQNLRIDATGGDGTGGITTINAGNGIVVSDNDGPTTEISVDNTLELGPAGSIDIDNASNQAATFLGGNATGGVLTIKEQPGNYDAVELSTRSNNDTRLGGQIFVRGRDGLSSIHMFADGSTDGGRIVLREPPNENLIVLTGENGGRVDVFDGNNNSQAVISLNGAENLIYTSGRIAINTPAGEMPTDALTVVGDVDIRGELSKSSGSFTIDHPLDPLNKTLRHSFVESPDMMNVYNGNVTLDENGEAWIELPDYFEELNRDFRYQLTCVGGFAPVYIANKIEDNRFKIAGGTQGLEVSWQVTGIRQDPYAELHRITVEEEKTGRDRGRYLNPDAYGISIKEN